MTPRQDHRSGYICRCAECRGHKPPARDPLVGDLFAGTDDAPVVAPAPAGSSAGAPDPQQPSLFDQEDS